jgi:hypothetical protein
MSDRVIEVEVYTSNHKITGLVHPGAPGLFSYMNRPTESYIELEDSTYNLLHQIDQPPETCGKLWLVKKEVVAMLVEGRGELGPSGSVRAGYTKPFPHWVRVVVGGYELRGQIYGGGRFDFGALMFEGENTFIPLYEVELSALLFPRVQARASAMIFNKLMVNAMSMLPSPELS